MMKLRRRADRDAAPPPAPEPATPPRRDPIPTRAQVSATSVDPERTEDVAAWLRAASTASSAATR